MSISVYIAALLLLSLWILYWIVQWIRRRSLDYLPGPSPTSWLIGNMDQILRPKEAGEAELMFTKNYGTAVYMKAPFGALQYILNTSGYNFPKAADRRLRQEIIVGRGILWAEGAHHARQRKIMSPAFSFSALRGFVPLFRTTARKAVMKIRKELGGDTKTVNMLSWMHRTTLDAIGEAGFGYKFEAVEKNRENKLAKVYEHFLPKTFMDISDISIAFEAFLGSIPSWLTSLITNIPVGRFKLLRDHRRIAAEIAREIIDKQTALYLSGKEGSKDIMSLLTRANLSEDPKTKLTHAELISQMTTLLFAGHDTTANATSWFLYEVAKRTDYQIILREEVKNAKEAAFNRGDAELSIADYDSMKYMLAAMKETLRYHPIVSHLSREAGKDDVIPLDIPQKTKNGETITSVPVSKGHYVLLSLAAYNRLPQVWGSDADQWRPERFLKDIKSTQKTTVGVIGNVSSFSSGLRSCIGWRFAVLEMQAILAELLENFEFSLPENVKIIPAFAGLRTPIVKGTKEKISELPLVVKPL
ncbi:hypothetical protein M422DRAFT_249745 [Sphaerobolus stellatus SS14]|uniref:Cytochrome P450 n=1 Tax=Sphaerobolus stellatus (strain SS14) TaxID=990650 RepID=A0A0C9W3J5_SPHS4|nr:hypothetical protein M422DRAFT_249745 [Sphaerobolus stellatus SS14]